MKKFGWYSLATVVVAILIGSAAHANEVTFSWTGVGPATASGSEFSFQSIVTASSMPAFTVGELGTAVGTVSGGKYDFTLDGQSLLTGGSYDTFSFFGTEYVSATGTGGTLNLSYDPSTGGPLTIDGGFIAPAPEASSLVALSAVLAASALLMFSTKRKSTMMAS